MSGGRAHRRKQKSWQRKQKQVRVGLLPCPLCGSTEPHYVPPSFGDKGFYACSIVANKEE